MTIKKDGLYEIEGQMLDNWIAVLEELIINGNKNQLMAWFNGEYNIIEQSLDEMQFLEPIKELD